MSSRQWRTSFLKPISGHRTVTIKGHRTSITNLHPQLLLPMYQLMDKQLKTTYRDTGLTLPPVGICLLSIKNV